MVKGIIYILTNPSFPDFVKIGYADNLEKRLEQLNRSETIPFAFRVYAVYEVENRLTDLKVHDLIDKLNPDLRTIETFDGKKRQREFYAMTPEDAYDLFDCIAQISGTTDRLKKMKPEGHEILDEQLADDIRSEERSKTFRFSMCGIMPGEKICFVNDKNVVATVVDDRRIEYDGEITSCSALAKKLLGYKRNPQGTLFFTYKGKILNDLRAENERDNG